MNTSMLRLIWGLSGKASVNLYFDEGAYYIGVLVYIEMEAISAYSTHNEPNIPPVRKTDMPEAWLHQRLCLKTGQ